MSTILLDFESVSTCDLTAVGGRGYWLHPTTEAICCWLYEVESATWVLWLPSDPCPFTPEDVLVAHNAMGFDRFGAAALGWRALDAGPPWIDTSELARVAGLPGALDALAKRWLGREKDHAGNAVTRRLSGIKAPLRKRVDGVTMWEVPAMIVEALKGYGGVGHPIPPVVLGYVIKYCRSDVEVLVDAWPKLAPWLEADLPGVSEAERAVNDRGVGFDLALARRLLECDEKQKHAAVDKCAAELMCTDQEAREAASSPKQFKAATGAPNARATTVAAIDHPLARLREAINSIASGKLTAGLSRVSPDGRIRDAHRYFGAHTGRWSQRGMQLHNMPRPDKRFEEWGDVEICDLASRVLAGYDADQDEIDLLLRATLVPAPGCGFVWCDYSAVEGRGVAWGADDRPALKVYTDGLDPYKYDAQSIYGVAYDAVEKWQRQNGKVTNLALGFGGGKGAFENMARSLGVDISGLDVPAIVAAWRASRPATVRFWYDMQRGFVEAACGREARVGAFLFTPGDAGSVALVLPSGRPLIYWDVQVSPGEGRRVSITYEGLNFREHLYGGKIVENAIQAMCRDMLADAMVRCEREGLPVVLHVHDELMVEIPLAQMDDAKKRLHTVMNMLPKCYEGFPPGAKAESGRRYRK